MLTNSAGAEKPATHEIRIAHNEFGLDQGLPVERLAHVLSDPSSSASDVASAQAELLGAPASRDGSDLAVLARNIEQDVYYKSIARAGDLNGDGSEDVLTVERPLPSFDPAQLPLTYPPAHMVARSGETGAVLWSIESSNYAENLYVYLGVPGTPSALERNGRPLIVTMDVTSPGGVRANVIRQTVSVLDGATGSRIWSRELLAAGLGDMGITYPVGHVGLVYSVAPIVRQEGDDLLLTLVSGATGGFTATGLVLDGLTGAPLGSVTASSAGIGTFPWVVPAREPSASTPALLAVSSSPAGASASLHPIPAGPPFWTVPIANPTVEPTNLPRLRMPLSLGQDRYLIDLYQWYPTTSFLAVIADGQPAWEERMAGISDRAGDVSRDGIDDVIAIVTGPSGIDMRTLSGFDKSTLWTRHISLPATGAGERGYLSLCVPCSGDVNGDGAAETLIASWVRQSGGTVRDRRSIAIDGASGTDLWVTPTLAGYTEHPFALGSDLTGDGTNDVVGILASSGGPRELNIGVAVHDGRDYAFSWQALAGMRIEGGRYFISIDLMPVRLTGSVGVFMSVNGASEVRQPDGTVKLVWIPSTHMLTPGGRLWSA